MSAHHYTIKMIHLSERTAVEVQLGKYGPYLAVGRKQRWVYLSKTAVGAIDVQKIDKFIQNEENGKVHLCRNQNAVVSQYQGHVYVGFQCLDVHGEILRGKGVNLNRDEWQELVAQLPRLMSEIKSTPTTLTQYKHGDRWDFLQAEASDDTTRQIPRPSPSEMLLKLYRYPLEREIRQQMTANCHGCQFDCPDQRDHMDVGCLMDYGDAVEMYLAFVQLNINARDLEEMYRQVEKALNLPTTPIYAGAAEIVIGQNPPLVIADVLKKLPIPDDYRRLFQSVLA